MIVIDHAYAEAHELVDAYLAGRLDQDEREAFEAHYFDCPLCLDQLEAAEDFREGMRQVGVEEAVRGTPAAMAGVAGAAGVAEAAGRRGLASPRLERARTRRLALAACLILALGTPLALLVVRERGLERRLQAARVAGAAAAARRIASLEDHLRAAEQAGQAGRQRLAAELARERQARAGAEGKLASAGVSGTPEINVSVFLLAAVRGVGAGEEPPVNRLPIAAGARTVVLTLELAAPADHPAYRATLAAADGRQLWQAEGLRPDGRGSLALSLPAPMLPPGRYRLAIDGAQGHRRWAAVAAYPFAVVRPDG